MGSGENAKINKLQKLKFWYKNEINVVQLAKSKSLSYPGIDETERPSNQASQQEGDGVAYFVDNDFDQRRCHIRQLEKQAVVIPPAIKKSIKSHGNPSVDDHVDRLDFLSSTIQSMLEAPWSV